MLLPKTVGGSLLVDEKQESELLDLITPKSSPNGGVDVTDDLKYNSAAFPFSLVTLSANNTYWFSFYLYSQDRSSERDPCDADGVGGWIDRKLCIFLVWQGRMDQVLGGKDHGLGWCWSGGWIEVCPCIASCLCVFLMLLALSLEPSPFSPHVGNTNCIASQCCQDPSRAEQDF